MGVWRDIRGAVLSVVSGVHGRLGTWGTRGHARACDVCTRVSLWKAAQGSDWGDR